MTDQGGLPALVGLLPPSAGAGMTVGWEAVQEAWELVTWGASSSADLYCWLTHGEPEDWPVVVFSHGDDTWTRFDCGMTEFLRRVFSADGRAEAMKDSAL
ncbi:hypothetical protein ACH4NS_34110 [Streptomyces mutabilis]|uniref:hypothetical protein n=1 Tax=Streptomyces mutabilis TaxID=67332 RepID=UPI0036B58C1F